MFTIDQIKEAHSKVRSGADFPQYVKDIVQLGVAGYDLYVADGRADYFSSDGFTASSAGKSELLLVADNSDVTQFKQDLLTHQQGNTDYQQFCIDSAKCGVEKWRLNFEEKTCTYYDKAGNIILTESITAV